MKRRANDGERTVEEHKVRTKPQRGGMVEKSTREAIKLANKMVGKKKKSGSQRSRRGQKGEAYRALRERDKERRRGGIDQ